MKPMDSAIKKDVIDQLEWDSRVEIRRLDVSVSQGRVTLSGTVPSFRMREIAGRDVLEIPGVSYLANELKVEYQSAGELPDDNQVLSNLEKMLHWDPDISSENITVDVSGGVVTFSGTVNAIWQKLKAEHIASNVSGVLQIVNMLTVVPEDTYTDQAVSEAIMAAFNRNAHIDVRDVNVTVADQVVTLSGTVPGWKAYYKARDIACHTRGVVDVENNLTVT